MTCRIVSYKASTPCQCDLFTPGTQKTQLWREYTALSVMATLRRSQFHPLESCEKILPSYAARIFPSGPSNDQYPPVKHTVNYPGKVEASHRRDKIITTHSRKQSRSVPAFVCNLGCVACEDAQTIRGQS